MTPDKATLWKNPTTVLGKPILLITRVCRVRSRRRQLFRKALNAVQATDENKWTHQKGYSKWAQKVGPSGGGAEKRKEKLTGKWKCSFQFSSPSQMLHLVRMPVPHFQLPECGHHLIVLHSLQLSWTLWWNENYNSAYINGGNPLPRKGAVKTGILMGDKVSTWHGWTLVDGPWGLSASTDNMAAAKAMVWLLPACLRQPPMEQPRTLCIISKEHWILGIYMKHLTLFTYFVMVL